MATNTRDEYLYFLAQQQAWLYAQPQDTQDKVCNGIGSRANWLYRKFNFKGWLYLRLKPAVDKHDIAYCCGGSETHKMWADDNLENELDNAANAVFFLFRGYVTSAIDKGMSVIRPLGELAFEHRDEPMELKEYLATVEQEIQTAGAIK